MQKDQKTKYQKHDKNNHSNHITAWEKSGMTKTEYCRQNGIPLSTFGNWKRRTKRDSTPSFSFIELKSEFPNRDEYMELQIDSDLKLFIRENIPPVLLRNILTAVRGM